ncbi:glycosyltransferase family 2 protein [Candidatus Margulisiibacteriota bacterium]
MLNKNKATIILPCYNESHILEDNLCRIIKLKDARQVELDIIVINDGSRDNTKERLGAINREFPQLKVINNNQSKGRGACVALGIALNTNKYVGFIDIDLEIPEENIVKSIEHLKNGWDAVIGKRRFIKDRGYYLNIHRYLASKIYNKLVRLLLKLPYTDTESGIKFFKAEKIIKLLPSIRANHWFWDTEAVYYMHQKKFKIMEMACSYRRNWRKRSSVSLAKDSIYYLKKLSELYLRK